MSCIITHWVVEHYSPRGHTLRGSVLNEAGMGDKFVDEDEDVNEILSLKEKKKVGNKNISACGFSEKVKKIMWS